jgi:long-chain acyl-CoA synthetase
MAIRESSPDIPQGAGQLSADPREFADLAGLVAEAARARPASWAVVEDGGRRFDYRRLDTLASQVAATLQHAGLAPGDVVAICASSSFEYVAVFVGALRAGIAVAPLSPSATPVQLMDMVRDSRARVVFVDGAAAAALEHAGLRLPPQVPLVRLDPTDAEPALDSWLLDEDVPPSGVAIDPEWIFNVIYSSGTTGTPKGIAQSHAMRWNLLKHAPLSGVGPTTVTMVATPLYSNTTLTVALPTLAWGGCLVLMPKFEIERYLTLAQAEKATHAMLVPVQYQRLMAHPHFDRFDLSSFKVKFCTSAPFRAELKADVVARWPGRLVEFYGMTEGGGTCILDATLYPNKLHTVGLPAEGHDIRLIDEAGREVARIPGGASQGNGEVVGRSPAMMSGYHYQPGRTTEAEWFDAEGRRYIRTGDIGRFDEDGFLILMDRHKDMLISGGFNVYPSDLEAVLLRHPDVADAAVVGVPSAQWGETPVGFVVRRDGSLDGADAIRLWANQHLGKTQRLSDVRLVVELPRNAIGKVLKRQLRDSWKPTELE